MEGLLVTHARTHLDEIMAIGLYQGAWGLKPGPKHYEWASHAEIIFLAQGGEELRDESGEYLTDFIEAETPTLYIGVGRGKIDEHRQTIPTCAAVLAAEDLGIATAPELTRLLRRVFTWETKGHKQPFDFASLVDAQWERCENEPEKVFAWTNLGIQAEITRCRLHVEHRPPVRGLQTAYDWLVKFTETKLGSMDKSPEDVPELARLAEKCKTWTTGTPENSHSQLLDLADLTDGIMEVFGEEQAFAWFCDAAEAEYLRQRSYFESQADFENAKIIEITVSRRPLRIAFIESKQRMAHSFALSHDIGVAVVNDSGHVRIIPRRGLILPVETVGAILRAMEAHKNGLPIPRWRELTLSDPPSSAKEWYIFTPKGSSIRWILNGSLSAPGIAATKLEWPREIEFALVRGLADQYYPQRQQEDIQALLDT